MADEAIQDDEAAFEEPTDDKTVEEEAPKEDESGEEKKPEEGARRSEIAQKIKYREKYNSERSKRETLETELVRLRDAVKKPTDDQEAKAQEYIREQARKVYEELQNSKQKEEEKRTEAFESEIEELLEANPDISETELLDVIEEYEVEPKTALKILQKQENKAKKPKMPVAKRGASETVTQKSDDSGKTMWDILKEETSKIGK